MSRARRESVVGGRQNSLGVVQYDEVRSSPPHRGGRKKTRTCGSERKGGNKSDKWAHVEGKWRIGWHRRIASPFAIRLAICIAIRHSPRHSHSASRLSTSPTKKSENLIPLRHGTIGTMHDCSRWRVSRVSRVSESQDFKTGQLVVSSPLS